MNTFTAIAAILLPTLSAGLAAQDLNLLTKSGPKQMVASIDGAEKGRIVILVLGLDATPSKLPSGQMLGVSPDWLAACAVADGHNACQMEISFGDYQHRGFVFYAQAVAIDLEQPLDGQKFALSPVNKVVVAAPE